MSVSFKLQSLSEPRIPLILLGGVGQMRLFIPLNISFNDEDALAKLNEVIAPLEELQQTYPDADIFLKVELTVDFPEDVKIAIEPNQMATASLSGNRIKFSYCELGKASAYLNEQYAVGTVEVKVVQPRSKYDI